MPAAERNELLTRVGRETPVGALFRRYWLPVLLGEELPEPDCAPVRLKLLGECLIAFRDTEGKLGLIGEFCAHRGVSLWFGRNEENGIRHAEKHQAEFVSGDRARRSDLGLSRSGGPEAGRTGL